MAEAAAEEGRRAHLPEQPREGFRPRRRFRRQEGAELLGEMQQEAPDSKTRIGTRSAAVDQCGDLGVGIGLDEARAELLSLADLDNPRVIFGAGMAERQQLLQQDRDLLAVGVPNE